MQNFLPECVESESARLRYLASRCLAARKQIKFIKNYYHRELNQLRENMKHDLDNLSLELERLELDTHHQRDRLDGQDEEDEFLYENFVKLPASVPSDTLSGSLSNESLSSSPFASHE